jgi:predicted dehydrogenase
MVRFYAQKITQSSRLPLTAICDTNIERVEIAKQELPNLKGYFTNLDEMLNIPELDLVFVVLPQKRLML